MALLAQIAMGAAVRSDAAVAVAPEASPAVIPPGASPAAIHPVVFPEAIFLVAFPVVTHLEGSPAVIPLGALRAVAFQVEVSQVVMVAVSRVAMAEGGTVDDSI